MSIKRGPFRIVCDARDCEEFIDLETDDFEEAKELRDEAAQSEGWTTYGGHNGWKNFCPSHCIDDC